MVVMGPHSRLSILVVGFVDVSGPSSSTVDPGGGPCGQSSMVVVGARCASWGLWEERGSVVWHCVRHPNWDVLNCIARPLILDTVSRISLIPFRGVCHHTYILVQPLCLCLQIKLNKFGHKSEERHILQNQIFVQLMYNYLYFLVLLYHCHWKHRHIGADIKYKLVFMSTSLKLHILLK